VTKRHVSPPSSSFAHLKLRRLPGVLILAQGSQRGLRRRQFWSNICPRKNKSPLSLTTGRASLVSNRALLNRRRITDPRPFRLLSAPSFRSRSASPVVSSSGDFFFHQPQNRKTIRRLARLPVLSSKTLSDFRCRYFVPFFLLARSIVSDDLGRARLKSRVPAKNAGRLSGAIVSSEHESSAQRRFADLSRFLLSSFFR
jgi:hypothetical protein